MAVTHTYTPSASGQNKWTVSGAGTWTLAALVTYDEANALTLLAATNGAKLMTMTYQIRPAARRALQITFTVASKTTETDYIWITGVDAWDNALYECIDVSAGNGAYTSVQYFRTITQIDCEDVGDGSGTAWADGTLAVTQPILGFIWKDGDQYTSISPGYVEHGDGSSATQFVDSGFVWYCDEPGTASDQQLLLLTNQSTLTLTNFAIIINSAYAIRIIQGYSTGGTAFTYQLLDGIIMQNGSNTACQLLNSGAKAESYVTNIALVNARFNGHRCAVNNINVKSGGLYSFLNVAGTVSRAVFCGAPSYHVYGSTSNGLNAFNLSNSIEPTVTMFYMSGITTDKYVTDCTFTAWTITWAGGAANTASLYRRYTCNITVADKDGTLLDDVTVLCEDTDGNEVFSVLTGATDTGKIDEQTVNYIRYYYDGAGTSKTYSPHKFTLSAAGYETLVMENVTIDGPIEWRVELQPQTAGIRKLLIWYD